MTTRPLIDVLALLAPLVFMSGTLAQSVDFSNNGDGTVTDPNTGLVWMRCSWGQTWTGSACTGSTKRYTFDQAVALNGKISFAGHSDWRVPSHEQLRSIVVVNITRPGPSINVSAFPNTESYGYWSSTVHPHHPNFAWFVDFDSGGSNGGGHASPMLVRLVRGGP